VGKRWRYDDRDRVITVYDEQSLRVIDDYSKLLRRLRLIS